MMQVDCPKKCSCLTTKKMRKLREILSSQNIRGGSGKYKITNQVPMFKKVSAILSFLLLIESEVSEL